MAFETITEMFLQTTTEYADRYLYFARRSGHWEGLRGKDIRATVEDLAFGLVSMGVGKGVKAAILSSNSPRWAMADYGILCTGAATVTIYPTLIPAQVAYILKHSESQIVFAQDEEQAEKVFSQWDALPDLKAMIVMNGAQVSGLGGQKEGRQVMSYIELLDAGHDENQERDFEALCRIAQPDDLLTLIYTSGTTAEPKGVMLSHHNLVTNIHAASECIRIYDYDSLLSFLPLSHSFERMAGHFLAFSRGASTYYAQSIEAVAENMREVKPTILLAVPRFYEKVYNRVLESVGASPALRQKIFWWALGQGKAMLASTMAGKRPGWWLKMKHRLASKLVFSKLKDRVGGRIRFFVSGAAPLSAEIAEFFVALDMVILEGYGLTETSPALSINTLEKFKFGKVGAAIPGVELKISADGEILTRGANIMLGYFKDSAATAEAIDSDGWFHTGDIGELDEDGFLKITDRKKSILVTSAGKNVAPAPLENALVLSPYIEQVYIIGDKRNFVSALLVPNFEKLETFADEAGLPDRSRSALIADAQVNALVEQEVEAAMEPFSRYERVRKFTLLPREFTIKEDELTPTLKVKRRVVSKHFEAEIETLYADANPPA